jgi:hypothetical protein
VPRFQHDSLARFKHEHRIGLIMFVKKELVRWNGHYRTNAKQELEDVSSDSTKNRHALQE